MESSDPFDLKRFVRAQDGTFETAITELRGGRKRSHWMWFVFPQMQGLGSSSMAQAYGITSLAEARAYLAHPLLGPRLIECTEAVLAVRGRSLQAILGSPDDKKFCSCMTLFAKGAEAHDEVFRQALNQLCDGRLDSRTLALLEGAVD